MLTRNLQRKQEAAAIRDSGWSFVAGRADRLVAPAEGVTGSQGGRRSFVTKASERALGASCCDRIGREGRLGRSMSYA